MGNRNSGNYTVKKMTLGQRRKAVLMFEMGGSPTKIAKKFGVSRQYTYALMKPKAYKSS